MTHNKFWTAMSNALTAVTMTLIVTLVFARAASASTYKILHQFGTALDGENPYAGLIFDAAGNLYGTTYVGGADNFGVVFKLTPNTDGSWTESVLHSFTGAYPAAGVIMDAAGNLYGTTEGGGSAYGYGVVFELTPTDGSWTESVLHTFMYFQGDGAYPFAGVIFDKAGNLYGTTTYGGDLGDVVCRGGCGIVFKLTPTSSGWNETVLHRFQDDPGEYPYAGVIMDAAGNLYGTTSGQDTNYGLVFELTPSSSGWSETMLHKFLGVGSYPRAGVIMDAAGNLYGTASSGLANYGLVYEITP
jgi:uncharacterized repeat protein (TIGR03803 family)